MVQEINIPSAEKQDQIKEETDKIQGVKDNTDYIRGQFPLDVSGGTDWSTTQGFFTYEEGTQGNTRDTLLDITGSGYLISILNKGTTSIYYGIDIDNGTIKIPESRYGFRVPSNQSISLFIRFNQSLRIGSTTDSSRSTMISYILD